MPVTLRNALPMCMPVPSMVNSRMSLSCGEPRILSTVSAAAHLAEHLDVAQQDDRVGHRRDVRLGDRRAAQQRRGRRGEEAGHLLVLDERREADDELAEAARRRDALERGEAVDRDAVRLELLDDLLHADQVVLERQRSRGSRRPP